VGVKMEIKKIIQIVNYLLKLNNESFNYTKLIKMLYLADRAFLEKYNDTITNDTFCSMDNGQVLSELYDLIKGKDRNMRNQTLWDTFFETEGYDLKTLKPEYENVNELNDAEIEVIRQINEKYKNYSMSQLINLHHDLPEWEDPKGSSIVTPTEKILTELGKSQDEVNWIMQEQRLYEKEKEFLDNCCSE